MMKEKTIFEEKWICKIDNDSIGLILTKSSTRGICIIDADRAKYFVKLHNASLKNKLTTKKK